MIPFNLEAAKKGKPVVTREGYAATYVTILKGVPAPLVMEVNGDLENYYLNGRFETVHNHALDLFMEDDVVLEYDDEGEDEFYCFYEDDEDEPIHSINTVLKMTLKEYYRRQPVEWLIDKLERNTNRYMDNEQFLMSVLVMPWWKRLFIRKHILNHLRKITDFYDDLPAPGTQSPDRTIPDTRR